MPIHPKAEAYLKILLQSVMMLCILIITGVMLIWLTEPRIFTVILPESATMKFNTALLFLGVTILTWLINRPHPVPVFWWRLLIIMIISIAGLSLISYGLDTPLFLDELVVSDPLTSPDQYPGRMSESTAMMFLMFGFVFLTWEHLPRLSEAVAISINMMGLTAVFAFVFDFDALYTIFFFSTISIHTAFMFVALSGVCVLTMPNGFIHNLIILDEPGGVTLRWLIPVVLLIPFVLGWLILEGMNNDMYPPAFAIALLVVLIIVLQLFFSLFYSSILQNWYRLYREKQKQFLDSKISLIELENVREMKELKEVFFAKLSHDMRQPITIIVTSSDIVLQYGQKLSSEKREQHVKRIRNQAMTMLDFLEDIMLLSQLEWDEIPVNKGQQDIVKLCYRYATNYFKMLT